MKSVHFSTADSAQDQTVVNNVSFGGQVGVHYDAGWTSGGVRVQLGPVGNIAIPIGKKDGKYEDATLTVSDNEISAEGYFTVLGHGGGIKCDAIGKCPELTKHHDAFSKSSGEEFTHKFRNGSKSKTGVDLPFGVNVEVDWTAAREILRRQLDKVKQLVGDPQ